jgi:hypothetical protein
VGVLQAPSQKKMAEISQINAKDVKSLTINNKTGQITVEKNNGVVKSATIDKQAASDLSKLGSQASAVAKNKVNSPSEERSDAKSRTEPAGADYKFDKANKAWKDQGKISVEDVDGKKIIKMRLTVSGFKAKEVAARVMNCWNGATAEYEGVTYQVDADIKAVEENGDWISKRMDRKDEIKFYQEYDTNGYRVGGVVDDFGGSKVEFMRAWTEPGTVAHEFGHALGLRHAPKGTGSIMSYDPVRSVKGKELSMLAEGYK